MISLIAAVGSNRVIGDRGEFPLYMPKGAHDTYPDLSEHLTVVGRRTWESITDLCSPVIDDNTIILTRDQDYAYEGAHIAHSINEAMIMIENDPRPEAFVIGGGKTFQQFMPFADKIYRTKVHGKLGGNILFPITNMHEWAQTWQYTPSQSGTNDFVYSLVQYERRK